MAKGSVSGNGNDKEAEYPNHPLFFTDPKAISIERHRSAGLKSNANFGFARQTNSIPLTSIEFIEAAHYYPIVFTPGDKPLPIALVGLENWNYFVNDAGQWIPGAYIPAYVRKYPFAMVEVPEKQKWVLCVDEGAPHYLSASPDQPFFKDDKATEMASRAMEFCAEFHRHMAQTEIFCKALVDKDLLVDRVSKIELPDGSIMNLRGFRVIDQSKLQTLSDSTIAEWYRSGWIMLIDILIFSMHHWKRLNEMAFQAKKAA